MHYYNPSEDEIVELAYKVVDSMNYDQKDEYIAEDLIHLMSNDKELYFANLDTLKNVR